MTVLAALGCFFVALSIAGALYTLYAAFVVGRFMGRRPAGAATLPTVTILKPLHGAQAGLDAGLESFCAQDYRAAVQIVLGVQTADDPSAASARRLAESHAGLDITVVVDPTEHGENRKISNLINMTAHARGEMLVVSDADIAVGPDYLRRIIAELAVPGVGAVTCLYRGRGVAGPWSRLSAMGIDYHFLPSAVVGVSLGLARPCFGSTIALTARRLQEIGGFAAFADELADDYRIGAAIRSKGLTVAIPPMVVVHHCAEASFAEYLDHQVRWALTVRRIDPAGHAGSLVTHAFPLSVIGALLLAPSPAGLGLIFTTLVVRMALKFRIDAATGGRAGPWWLLPLADVLSFAVFLASFAGGAVVWQGRRFRVGHDGLLSQEQGS
ncbi:MAG: bacteriohopanetetrol glucosamine biosynthesis glycosyltransferase HpnI [Caulobacteraceae bacterium]